MLACQQDRCHHPAAVQCEGGCRRLLCTRHFLPNPNSPALLESLLARVELLTEGDRAVLRQGGGAAEDSPPALFLAWFATLPRLTCLACLPAHERRLTDQLSARADELDRRDQAARAFRDRVERSARLLDLSYPRAVRLRSDRGGTVCGAYLHPMAPVAAGGTSGRHLFLGCDGAQYSCERSRSRFRALPAAYLGPAAPSARLAELLADLEARRPAPG